MIDFTRRRFLFGLAAAPLVVPAVKHFVMPKWEPKVEAHTVYDRAIDRMLNPPFIVVQGSYDNKTWHDLPRATWALGDGGVGFGGAWKADKELRCVRLISTVAAADPNLPPASCRLLRGLA